MVWCSRHHCQTQAATDADHRPCQHKLTGLDTCVRFVSLHLLDTCVGATAGGGNSQFTEVLQTRSCVFTPRSKLDLEPLTVENATHNYHHLALYLLQN